MSQNQTPAIVPGDKTKGAQYIAEHPTEFGFKWGAGKIGHRPGDGKTYVELRENCPHIEFTPELIPLFVATWGAEFLSKALNGTSIKVGCDRVNRDTLEKARNTSNDTLREKIVSSVLLGVVVRTIGVATTKFVVNGKVYTSEEDAKKASVVDEKSSQLEKAQNFLATASDNGVPSDVALNMARQMFPLAFEQKAEQQ